MPRAALLVCPLVIPLGIISRKQGRGRKILDGGKRMFTKGVAHFPLTSAQGTVGRELGLESWVRKCKRF